MATSNKTVRYTKAVIDKEKGVIIERLNDCENVYYIDNLLNDWNGVEGVTITIKKDEELPSED